MITITIKKKIKKKIKMCKINKKTKFCFFVFNKKVKKEFCFKTSQNLFLMRKIIELKNNLWDISLKNI